MSAPDPLPTGTVTFLFTDVEGSTRLLQQHGGDYRTAIARHHEILRDAVSASRGVVFETIGDAVYAAFARVDDAAGAAIRAQRGLGSEAFATGAVRVRMGIHLGDVELTEDRRHYFGPALYRCARLMATGHGGQVLVSSAAAAILGDAAPAGVTFRDLGEHRLKDLLRAERIYQLEAAGLETRFPPLVSLDARPNNLPVQRTPLVGREQELAQTRALLLDDETRLLTFVGPGGIGKTRLSLGLAAEASDQFAQGVFFVPLAHVTDPALVPNAIAGVLSVRDAPGTELADTIGGYLRQKHLLLVLDNFEHLLDAAELVGRLLEGAPGLRVLATSQAALRVYGEREYPVPALGLPNGARDPAALERSEAVRLFVQRARDVRPDLDTSRELGQIAEICKRLDGLPLAIELAAARMRTLAPGEILARLERRLSLLTGGARDLPARQRTLRDALGWSHDLLDERERTVFRRLAVFNGGATLDAIEAVVAFGSLERASVVETVDSLASKSLVRADAGRVSMLAVIREFAGERLEDAGEAKDAARRHAEHFVAVARRSDEELRLGDELREEAWALTWAAYFAAEARDAPTADRLGRAAIARAREAADPRSLCFALAMGVYALSPYGDDPSAADLVAEAKAAAEASGDRWWLAFTSIIDGEILRGAGDDDAALREDARALEISREIGSRALLSTALVNPSHIHLRRGRATMARAMLAESERLFAQLGDAWGRAYCLVGLGGVAIAEGRAARGAASLGAADAWFAERGIRIQDPDRAEFERYVANARGALDEAAFAAAWSEGKALSLDDAIALALST